MQTMKTPAYKSLVSLAKKLGGQIVALSTREWEGEGEFMGDHPSQYGYRGWYQAPFTNNNLGVYWAKKLIVHPLSRFSNASLIHEMGHVFACRYPPHHRNCDETHFLGWEIQLAENLGLKAAWMREMSSYGVHVDDEDDPGHEVLLTLGELTRKKRDAAFRAAIETAKQRGSLGPNNEIRSVRS